MGVDGDGMLWVVFVDVDYQDVIGVWFDVVEVGDFWCIGVLDLFVVVDLGK